MTVPTTVMEVASVAVATPKSTTTGWSSASSTLPGFRSRWVTPARWMVPTASARATASARRRSPCSGPAVVTSSSSVGPFT